MSATNPRAESSPNNLARRYGNITAMTDKYSVHQESYVTQNLSLTSPAPVVSRLQTHPIASVLQFRVQLPSVIF